VLFGLGHLTFGYHASSFASGVQHASALRRVVVLLAAGGRRLAWYLLRRCTGGRDLRSMTWCGMATGGYRSAAAQSPPR
jgi:hypothetical protein